LIVFTQEQRNRFFFLFIVISFIIGLVSEIIGTNTGLLFGSYAYSSILGLALKKVPLIIGVNWFVVVYCCGVSMKTMQDKLNTKFPEASISSKRNLKRLSLILDGALLAVLFDWLMEPVAIKLGYWSWTGDIPFYNYCCWFLLSSLLLWLFDMLPFTKRNKFAVHLLLIQSMFFLLLRSFL
jgi:putative membrane protein